MLQLDDFYSSRKDTPSELLESATGWETLATEEEQKLTWDREALPSTVARKAALYRKVASELRDRAAKAGDA